MGKKRKFECYICSKVATSREHIPPKCFFPEGASFRKNLITVPSCDDHNLQKSGDDEYLFNVVNAHIDNNPVALQQIRKKIIPGLMRRPWHMPEFFKGMFAVKVNGKQTGAFYIDRKRFDRSIEYMSRGIYFHHFNWTFVIANPAQRVLRKS